MNKQSTYTSLAANLAQKLSSWFTVAIVMLGMNIYLGIQMGVNAANQPVRLVPCGFDQADGPVTVTNNGSGNEQYISLIGQGDIALLTTWTPGTVFDRFSRLLNRMTPEMYAAWGTTLLSDATQHASSMTSQAFFVSSVFADKANEVEIRGNFRLWEGKEEMNNESKWFRIKYRYIGDMPMIASIEDVSPGTQRPGGQK